MPRHIITPGRPKGALNRKTQDFLQTLKERNYNVAEALLDIYEKALAEFSAGSDTLQRLAALKVAGDMAKEIASYSMPKLKAMEVSTSNPLDGMTNAEKLEKLKQAVIMLEQQDDKDGE
jgi:hypothetical protein